MHSSNVAVRNNITQTLLIGDTGITADHNLVLKNIARLVNGVQKNSTVSETGNRNSVIPGALSGFRRVDAASNTYDLHLNAQSPAIGAGEADGAPAMDIEGTARGKSIDMGAYAFAPAAPSKASGKKSKADP